MNKIAPIITALLIVATPFLGAAQKVVSSSGKSYTNSAGYLRFTVGEPVVKTYIGTNAHLSQGFHQDLQPPLPACSLLTTISSVPTGCNGLADGSAAVTATSGTTPYNYLWSSGHTTSSATGLSAAIYSVTVTDDDACVVISTVTVLEPGALSLSVAVSNASCGNNDGSATVTITGGTAPYNYQWSSGDSVATADSLVAGLYIVVVTDTNGCEKSAVATVSDANGPSITVNSVTDLNCFGDNDGAIDISVTGGSPPYTYSWSNGAATEDISNLIAAPYEIDVTDTSGCLATSSITVTQPDELLLNVSVSDATCGATDGSATVNVSGGTQSYIYTWSTGGSSSSETGLGAGVYVVLVSDANGCSESSSAAVSEIGAATITIDSIFAAGCGGLGEIYIGVSGGNAPYTYLWSTSDTTENLTGLTTGIYDVTVTGTGGCLATASATVNDLLPDTQNICMVTVDSATGSNLIVWEKPSGPVSFNIYRESTQSGVYLLAGNVLYDSLSTFLDSSSNPMQKSYRYKITSLDSCGNESLLAVEHKTMHLTINQGLGSSYNLIWDHYEGFTFSSYYIYRYSKPTGWVALDSIQSNLTSYTDFSPPTAQLAYQITVKPPSVCVATKQKNFNSSKSNTTSVSNKLVMISTVASTDANQGICNGTATITVAEGAPPYTYLWSDSLSQTSATAVGLCPGNYNVTVYDSDGDSITSNAVIGTIPGYDELEFGQYIVVFPNPSRGHFNIVINIPELNGVLLKVFSIDGQLVHEKAMERLAGELKEDLDISSAGPGIYYIQVITARGISTKKVIVQ